MFLTDLLQKNGFAVKTAENADDAMRRLEEEHPDLILDGRRDARPERLPAHARHCPRPAVRGDPDHPVHQQEPGNRPRLGHAPGRTRLHREAGQRSRPDVQDQRAGLSESRRVHGESRCSESLPVPAGEPPAGRSHDGRGCHVAGGRGGRGQIPLSAGTRRRNLSLDAAAARALHGAVVPRRCQPARRPLWRRAAVGIRLRRPVALRRHRGGAHQSRLVAFNELLEVNCALLVDRLAGLRGAEAFTASERPGAEAPAWHRASVYRCSGGALAGSQPASAFAATPVFEYWRVSAPARRTGNHLKDRP